MSFIQLSLRRPLVIIAGAMAVVLDGCLVLTRTACDIVPLLAILVDEAESEKPAVSRRGGEINNLPSVLRPVAIACCDGTIRSKIGEKLE